MDMLQIWILKPDFSSFFLTKSYGVLSAAEELFYGSLYFGKTTPQKLNVSVTRLLKPGWVKRVRSARVLLNSRTSCQYQYWRSVTL